MFVTTTLVVILFTVFIQVIYFTAKWIIYSIFIKCDLYLIFLI
jgi:hypothetical protein